MKKTMQPTPPVSAEMPKWLEHTPAETLYVLQQEDPGGEVVQEIPLARA